MTYHEEIEQAFQEFRGSANFRLSTSDWGLITKWELNRIPLVCVLRGLKEAFRFQESRRKRYETINSLAYTSRWVIAEWVEYRKRAT